MDSDLYHALADDDFDALKAIKRKEDNAVEQDLLLESRWLDELTVANNTVLHVACQHGSQKCVEEILRCADESLLLQINSRGETALHLAARQGHYDTVGALINEAKSRDEQLNDLENTTILQNLIRASNVEFETALHAAVRYNHEKVVELLVQQDPSYSYPRNKFDETPLYLAAARGYDVVIEVILQSCQSPTFGGPHGRNALHAAVMSDRGFDGNGQNILHIALKQNQKPLVKFIFSRTRKFDTLNTLLIQKDHEGNTPLHLIAKFRYYFPELRGWLQKADYEVVDSTNLTPPEVLFQYYSRFIIDEEGSEYPHRNDIYSFWDSWTRDRVQKTDRYDPTTSIEKMNMYREKANSHMIVAALVTTVALTAGFAMPGGFNGNLGPDQGSPLLLNKPAFKIFMISDTLTLLFSISSLFLYFSTSFQLKRSVMFNLFMTAIVLNIVSIAMVMVAFITGAYAVLYHSKILAIIVCIISSLFILLVFAFCAGPFSTTYIPWIVHLCHYISWKCSMFKYELRILFRRIFFLFRRMYTLFRMRICGAAEIQKPELRTSDLV